MPRPGSPGPAFNPAYPIPSNPSISAQYDRKQKQRAMMGITAGAEDVKYQAKYRDLKKKVKEIESVSRSFLVNKNASHLFLRPSHTILVGQ